MGAVLLKFSGCEINSDTLGGEGKTGTAQGAADTVARFGDSFAGEADKIKGWETFGDVAFDVDELSGVTGGNDGI